MSWRAFAASAALTLATTSTLATRTAHAAPTNTPAPHRAVSVVISGPPSDSILLEATIRELLGRLQLTMVHGGAASTAKLASVEIDLADAAGAHVVVRDASGSVLLDRTVRPNEGPAIEREQIAHAVRGAAEAALLADDDRIAGRSPPPMDPPSEPAPPPPPPPPSSPEPEPAAASAPPSDRVVAVAPADGSTLALDVSTFGGVGLVSSETSVVPRVGGSLALASRRGLRPSLALGMLYAFPFTTGTSTLSSRSSVVSVRLVPAVELLRRSWFALEIGAGGGLDVLSVESLSSDLPATALGPSTTRVDPIAEAALTARVRLTSDVVLTLSVVSDFDFTSRRYVFDDGRARSDVFVPWTVRPMLLAGFSFAALGDAPFREARGR